MNYTYGYARVSTQSQELNRQLDILEKYNCNEILTEKISGTKSSRPELNKLKESVREGDTVIVESWSRLGRSTKDLIDLVDFFSSKNVKLISDKENFDTTTPQGRLMLTVFQAFAQFERDLIVERTKEGLKSARARGRVGGRPKVDQKKLDQALSLYDTKKYSLKDIKEMTGISSSTLYRYIDARRGNE
ncbi:recombinase family protein [uncultured Enterococcus sp.]|uniref:recombinase family protein n=1 Tax=uncultured Enterococcus sp. TaxID=167972 RepID=UPI002AA6C121|nr:recombinase family protein [uncultured Enterococcus sp.]